jgi:HK97 family phage prohead protease
MKLERRFTKGADVRAKGTDDKPAIEGYAAVFNEDYVLYEDSGCRFVESIKPGAFSRVLEEKQDTRCLFNHQPDNVLGRTTNKTLRMVQDRQGLSYDNDLDIRTSIAQNVRCFVQRGDVTGCSFAFRVSKQSWREEEQDGGKMTVYTRVIEEIGELYDVGPVTYPAYEGTSVGARGAGALARELRSAAWAEGIPAEIREKIRAKIQARADVVTGGDIPDGSDGDDDEQRCNCRCDACSGCTQRSAHPRSEVVSLNLARARALTINAELEL